MDVESLVMPQVGDPEADRERERLGQPQQLLGLDLVGIAGGEQGVQQPELHFGDAGGVAPGEQEVALGLG